MPRREGTSIHIKNLSDGIRHEEIRRVFGKYGHLVDVTVPVNYHSGRSKGFAFVEFEDSRDADDAVYNMNQTRIWGREITVEFTRGTRKTPAEMRSRDHGSRGSGGRYDGGLKRSRSRSPRRSSRRDGGYYDDEEDNSRSRRRRDVDNSSPRHDEESSGRRRHRGSRKSVSHTSATTPPQTVKESNGRRSEKNGNARARSPLDDDMDGYHGESREQRKRSKNSCSRREANHGSPGSRSRSPVSITGDHNSPRESPESRGSMTPN